MSPRRLPVAALLLSLSACGPAAEPLTPPPPLPPPPASVPPPAASATAAVDDFRAKPPPPGQETPFTPPRIEEIKLASGIRLLLVERHELPLVAMRFAFDRGADQAAPGLGGFMTSMLFQGTKKRNAIAISDELRAQGIAADASAEHDAYWISARCLADKLPATLDLVADVIEHPAFAKDELERVRSRRLTSLVQQNDQPGAILTNTMLSLLYPAGHPYRVQLLGEEAGLTKATAADLAKIHKESFVPDRLTLAVAGDVQKADLVAQIERAFAGWKGSSPKPSPPSRPVDDMSQRITLVDRPGLSQSSIAVATVGVPRLMADHDAITLMNTLLGGYFSSRLNSNLRERHAYTYGARSAFELRRGPGPFTAGGTFVREHTGDSVREIFTEIKRMREELVTQEELDGARIRAIRRLPSKFETASETAEAVATLSVLDLPLDEYATVADRLRKVTREDVQRAAQAHLAEDKLRVVVVGDAKVVKEQLEALGMGAVTVKVLPKASEKKAEDKKAPAKKAPAKAKK
ncbi:MAG: pitrilysin family protein [Byssovorax sp.]